MTLLLYEASAPLIFGLVGAACLLVIWLRRGRRPRFILYWAFGLVLLGWPQLPVVLEYAHVRFTLTDFNPLFTVSLPLAFLELLSIYLGTEAASEPETNHRLHYVIPLWFAAFWIVSLAFFRDSRTLDSYFLPLIAIFLFFAPAYLLILLAAWRRYRKRAKGDTRLSSGLLLITCAMLLGLVQLLFTLRELFRYPLAFWFVAISSPALLILGDVTVVALTLGASLFAYSPLETAEVQGTVLPEVVSRDLSDTLV